MEENSEITARALFFYPDITPLLHTYYRGDVAIQCRCKDTERLQGTKIEGENQLYDYGLSTLEQYGVTAETTARTRGALLCHTEKGLLILREFTSSEKKLKKQQELLKVLAESGMNVDSFLENQEGSLVSRDKDEIPYTLQHWYEGRECDTKSRDDILRSVRTLAKLHTVMKLAPEEDTGKNL